MICGHRTRWMQTFERFSLEMWKEHHLSPWSYSMDPMNLNVSASSDGSSQFLASFSKLRLYDWLDVKFTFFWTKRIVRILVLVYMTATHLFFRCKTRFHFVSNDPMNTVPPQKATISFLVEAALNAEPIQEEKKIPWFLSSKFAANGKMRSRNVIPPTYQPPKPHMVPIAVVEQMLKDQREKESTQLNTAISELAILRKELRKLQKSASLSSRREYRNANACSGKPSRFDIVVHKRRHQRCPSNCKYRSGSKMSDEEEILSDESSCNE